MEPILKIEGKNLKFSPPLMKHDTMKTYGGVEVYLHHS
jgi:hypothetical protein